MNVTYLRLNRNLKYKPVNTCHLLLPFQSKINTLGLATILFSFPQMKFYFHFILQFITISSKILFSFPILGV